jgi:type I restriction enzyme S subunit
LELFCPKYLYYYLKNLNIPSRGYNRHFKILKEQVVITPPLPEQEKIADILTMVQEAKEKNEAVIEAAKTLKKSMMQYLFKYGPINLQEAENTPLKKTEVGLVPEQWKIEKLGDICTISTGTTPSTNRKEYYQGHIPFIKTTEIINNIVNDATTLITEQAVDDYNLKIYKPGTVFLAMYGQGKTRGQVALLNIYATTTQNTAAIQPSNELDSKYLWNYLISQYEFLRSAGDQGHISHLNIGYVKQIYIPLQSIQEQKETSRILSSIDKKIEAEENKKKALDDLFKTLLANLMTGKIRVNMEAG